MWQRRACICNKLRYLSPKGRHFVLLVAKVHWTICSFTRDPLSERGLCRSAPKFKCRALWQYRFNYFCKLVIFKQEAVMAEL